MLMYFTVFAITIVYESLVHYVNNVVTSHSGKLIVHHIYSEVCASFPFCFLLISFSLIFYKGNNPLYSGVSIKNKTTKIHETR